jgi:hypothetical protein
MQFVSRWHAAALIGAALVTACADPAVVTAPASLEAGCSRLAPPLVEHACFHAQFGPFVTVAGSATRTFPATAPNVNTSHTHYSVTLPGSPGSNEGTVKFRPARTGDWAILASPDVSLLVLDAAGATVPTLLRHAVPAGECAVLRDVHVVSLVAGQTYRLVLGPSAATSIGLVIEKLSDFEAFFFADADGDGFGDPDVGVATSCVAPADHVGDDTDCDDSLASVFPGAVEQCDGIDNDCDGEVDEDAVPGTFFRDADGDGFGDPLATVTGCAAPAGYVLAAGDCADGDAAVHPGAAEVCDGIDNDCDGGQDEDGATPYYRDADGDRFGDSAVPAIGCVAPDGYVADGGDCDDQNAEVFPGEHEVCDGLDNDCDGVVDNLADALGEVIEHGCLHAQHGPFLTVDAATPGSGGAPDVSRHHTAYNVNLATVGGGFGGEVTFAPDEAGDFAVLVGPGVTVRILDENGAAIEIEDDRQVATCPVLARALLVELEGGAIYTLALGSSAAPETLLVIEEADHHEDDGDHGHDDGAAELHRDADGDGFGDPSVSIEACAPLAGYVANGDDCDDGDGAVHPGADEVCDGSDNDCDGAVDELDGADVCACADLVVEGSRSYCPPGRDDGMVTPAYPGSFAIPAELPVIGGNAGNGYAALAFRRPAASTEIRCRYRGGASRAHPTSPADVARGLRYHLQSCTDGGRAGDVVQADRVSLRIESGDSRRGATRVRVQVDVATCS